MSQNLTRQLTLTALDLCPIIIIIIIIIADRVVDFAQTASFNGYHHYQDWPSVLS